MTSHDRRAREKAAVQERILSAARDLFAVEGVGAVTMRKIAQAIDYTPAALYVHFKDKHALLQALCRHDFTALLAAQRRLADDPGAGDVLDRIRRVGLGLVGFAMQHPNHYRFMFMTELSAVEPAPEDIALMGNPEHDGYAHFVSLVAEAIRAGRFRSDLTDELLVAQTLWAGIHGVISLQLTFGGDPWIKLRPVDQWAELVVDALLSGLAREGGERGEGGEGPGKSRGPRADKSARSARSARPAGSARPVGSARWLRPSGPKGGAA